MKVLWKKLCKLFNEVLIYTIAILIFLVLMLVPLTIIAWCIQFWVGLF